jgi:Secretion system C-terminal sorting domain
MKITFTFVKIFLSLTIYSQIVYVDKFDAVYPPSLTGIKNYELDINNDNENDIMIEFKKNDSPADQISCPKVGGGTIGGSGWSSLYFFSLSNISGTNKLNAKLSSSAISLDCTNDTLNINDEWNNTAKIYKGFPSENAICQSIGFGSHKQGLRLLKTNPSTGALGYIFGYIDYSISNLGEFILHGWYYESSYNVPIVANSRLDYPFDGNCIHIDTVKVFDTIRTFISVMDTLVIKLNIPNSSGDLKINTIKVYPNPASSHIYVDMGTHTLLNNYELQILNNLGQPVFFSPIDKKEYYINLNTFGGKGIYFLRIKNSLGIIIETKKIVLE